MSQKKNPDNKRFKLNRKRQIILLSVLIIAIASVSVYLELVIKPFKEDANANSGKYNPFAVYLHPNVSISIDNRPVVIPSQIGINESLWKNHSLDKFGVPGMPMDEEGKTNMPGMAPIYTTNDNGRITVGSIVERNHTLQDFLNIWGEIDSSNKKVNATVNGKTVNDYRNIILRDSEQIKLDVFSIK